MITGLDHVVVAVKDIAAATRAMEALLGRGPSWRTEASGGGADVMMFGLGDTALELMAPAGEGETGARLAAVIEKEGEGLSSLVFATDDMDRLHRRWAASGLAPEPVVAGESRDALSGATRNWRRTRTTQSHGVRVFAMQAAPNLRPAPALTESAVTGLDHVVIRTPDPDRALAFYGARLGLDLRMDRTFTDFGARLMFLRCGDLIVEIAHDLKAGRGEGPDRLWGLSWRVANADAAQARLEAAGLDVSPVRPGRKPGTRVFTVCDGTCQVPTLMVEPAA